MVIIHKKKIESNEEKEARLQQEKDRAMGLQDEYQAKGFELVTWVQHNKGLVSGLIILLFLAGGGASAFLYYQQRQAEQASSAYFSALKSIEGLTKTPENAAKFEAAEKQLAEIATTHSKGVGTLADLYAAHLALENGQAAIARERYQNALKSLNKDNELYPLTLIGLGYAFEREGNKDESLKQFASLIEKKNVPGRDLALWEAARLSQEKNPEQAKAYLSQLLEEYPASLYENNAKRLKESL